MFVTMKLHMFVIFERTNGRQSGDDYLPGVSQDSRS